VWDADDLLNLGVLNAIINDIGETELSF